VSSTDSSARVPSLDGLRGLSALLVVLGHGTQALSRQGVLSREHWFLWQQGSAGVSVFFAISGFLITALLLREETATGRVSLRDFYVRRAFRILPAYWVFLLVAGVLAGAASWPLLVRCLLFLTDYQLPRDWAGWTFAHTWSLSVEEQFYLTWPAVLALLGARRALVVAGAVVLAAPAVRLASALAFPALRNQAQYMFHTRVDSLMVGCLLALLAAQAPGHRLLAALARHRVGLAAALGIVFVTPLAGYALLESRIVLLGSHLSGFYEAVVRPGLDALAAGAIVAWVTARGAEGGAVGRVLGARPLVAIGLGSYSLYLWQQPFFAPAFDASGLTRFPVNVVLAFGCAWLSYRFVERPALGLRRRLLGRAAAAGPIADAAPPGG
jgi:peptidoglycan/LPS O-acetylase OafA/YrhL